MTGTGVLSEIELNLEGRMQLRSLVEASAFTLEHYESQVAFLITSQQQKSANSLSKFYCLAHY